MPTMSTVAARASSGAGRQDPGWEEGEDEEEGAEPWAVEGEVAPGPGSTAGPQATTARATTARATSGVKNSRKCLSLAGRSCQHLMLPMLASSAFHGPPLDIDASVLRELKGRQQREKKPLGQLVSELLAQALAEPDAGDPRPLRWTAKPLGLKIDLEDREAVWKVLDGR